MSNYIPPELTKPNSHRSKSESAATNNEERKIEKVVSGTATIKKKSEVSKLKDVFLAEDVSNVKSYILSDVIIPAAKKLIFDILKDGAEILLWGGTGGSNRSSNNTSKVSYRNYYDRREDERHTTNARTRFDFDDIVFRNRGEVEAVREQMEDVIERYGFVTVADMYDMADLTQPYTSNKYGWTSIRSSEVVRVRDGYVLKLPKAMPID